MAASLRSSLGTGALVAGVGAVAWATGLPFLFPSLGPSAYLLATRPEAPASRPRRVVGGHALGVLAGLFAYHALAPGLVMTAAPPALTAASARLAASGVVAVGLTTGAMLATDLRHSPACATTLIVALGLLSTPLEGGVVVVAVATTVALHRGFEGVLAGRET